MLLLHAAALHIEATVLLLLARWLLELLLLLLLVAAAGFIVHIVVVLLALSVGLGLVGWLLGLLHEAVIIVHAEILVLIVQL